MVDYNASLLSTPTIQNASIDPRGVIPATRLRTAGPPLPGTLYFLMRGYDPSIADFERWKTIGVPDEVNPSGLPLVGITIQTKWSA